MACVPADGSSFDCQDCHSESLARFDPLTCDDCHRQDDAAFMQAHVADFGTDCLACHDGIDRYARDTFDYSQVLCWRGSHAGCYMRWLSCRRPQRSRSTGCAHGLLRLPCPGRRGRWPVRPGLRHVPQHRRLA